MVFRLYLKKFTLKFRKNVRNGRLEGYEQLVKISGPKNFWNIVFQKFFRRGSVFEIFEITQNGPICEYKWF